MVEADVPSNLAVDIPLQLARTVSACLKKRDKLNAQAALNQLAATPILFERQMPYLMREARKSRRLGLLFGLLAQADPPVSGRLALIAWTARIGLKAKRRDAVIAFLDAAAADAAAGRTQVRFCRSDAMTKFRWLPRAIRLKLWGLKYDGRRIPITDAFSMARELSSRFVVDKMAEHLYRYRPNQSETLDDWNKRAAFGLSFGHMLTDRRKQWIDNSEFLQHPAFGSVEELQSLVAELDLSKGCIFVCYHNNLIGPIRKLFRAVFPDAMQLATRGSLNGQAFSAAANPRAALFIALRGLMDGNVILAAPDGRHGNLSSQVELTGQPIQVSTGIALIAYEAECPTVWINLVHGQGRLVPVVVPGPTVEEGESFDAFTARWLAFYWAQVEAALVADPGTVTLRTERNAWGTTLSRAARAPAEPDPEPDPEADAEEADL